MLSQPSSRITRIVVLYGRGLLATVAPQMLTRGVNEQGEARLTLLDDEGDPIATLTLHQSGAEALLAAYLLDWAARRSSAGPPGLRLHRSEEDASAPPHQSATRV